MITSISSISNLLISYREPKSYKLYEEKRDAAPVFTFHLRPRIIQEGQTCKLLACLTGHPHPTVSFHVKMYSHF